MSKKIDIVQTIEELRVTAAAINDVADWLAEQFTGEAKPPDSVPEAKSETKPQLALEDVRAVLADMSRKGYTAEIRALLQKYGASKLSGIDPANYEALLQDVEGLNNAG